MANISRFAIAQKNILKYFTDTQRNVFTNAEVAGIFDSKRGQWGLPATMNTDKFVNQLIKAGFQEVQLDFPNTPARKLYTIGDVSAAEIASQAFPKAYLSHYTAVSFLGLTEQIPKTIYVTVEQSKKNIDTAEARSSLTQERIDSAFNKPQRFSEASAIWNDTKIILLKGKYTGNLGVRSVGEGRHLRLTDLERTLIDITVRPSYSGGLFEVLKSFRLAGESGKVSLNKLLSYLIRLDFIYPYHQAIGFLMERSGAYKEQQLAKLRALPRPFKFYIAYDIKDKEFSKEWNIYYPKSM